MKMVVGLGNPGKQYQQTRHNIGFMILDKLAENENLTFKLDSKMQAEVASTVIAGEKVLFVKPMTYMNESGRSVKALADYYQINEEDTLIVYDDLDMEVGCLRLRMKGSSGGHNGIKSIMKLTNWQKFLRAKIGIGRPHNHMSVVDHVLGKFTKDEQQILEGTIAKTERAINVLLSGEDFTQVMNDFN